MTLQDFIVIMKERLRKNNLTTTQSAKKCFQRNLKKSFKNNWKFIFIDRSLFIYPYTLTVEKTIKDILKERKESNDIAEVTPLFRHEVKEMKD